MTNFLQFSIQGIPYGCVFALIAIGLVLIYKTSGVFNLAFGAQAYVSAALFYITVEQLHWSKLAGFALSVLVAGPVIGLILDQGIFRHMVGSSITVKLVASIGLLIGIPPIVQFFWPGNHQAPPSLTPGVGPGRTPPVYHFGSFHVDRSELMIMVVTVLVVLAVGALFRYTSIGLKMRAVVESPRMVELSGINAQRVSTFAWILSSLLAALAGVLLAPGQSSLNDPNNFTYLLVAAMAAAAFGGLYSLPLTLLGGVLLGMTQQGLTSFLPLNSVFSVEFRPSYPFIVLVLLLLFWPPVRKRTKQVVDPLAGCDPPVRGLASAIQGETMRRLNRTSNPIMLTAFVLVGLFALPSQWINVFSLGATVSVIFLSITVLTGMSGQVSLCQLSFAGLGAFTAGQLAQHFNVPFIWGMLAGGAIGAAAGALVAIPALRLDGLYLSLATLAFAVMADNILFPLSWIGNGENGVSIPRPQIGPINFGGDRAYFVLSLIVLGICSGIVILVRRGTVGRFLAALRGSEVAAATIGINPVRSKFIVFALSAGLAGIGGAMYGANTIPPSPTTAINFFYLYSLIFVVLVLQTGSRTVEGAINAGVSFALITYIFGSVLQGRWGQLPAFLFGFGILGYVKHPEGILEFQKARSLRAISGFIDRRILRKTPEQIEQEAERPDLGDPDAVPLLQSSTAGSGSPSATSVPRPVQGGDT